jgi:hypothetical protein
MHTVNLGRADELRVEQQQMDELQAQARQQHGVLMDSLVPGWAESGEELDARVRASSEMVAREAMADLAEVLTAPVNAALAQHWVRLGGRLPD